jgi:ribonuclease BN (tRNA processing enzyme)
MGLSLTVLGCSGSFAGPGDACSGYLVQDAGTSLWIDAGPGTLANIQRHVPLAELDGLVLSHSHPDHWLEAPVLRNALRYVLEIEGLPVYGTAETLDMLVRISGEIAPTFQWTTITAGSTAQVGGLSLSFTRTDHPVETLAVRVDADGRSLVYSADTGPLWTAASFGDGIDLLLCEASLGIHHEGLAPHLSGRQAGVMAREAGVARLMLTHVVPGADGAQHRLDAEAAFGAGVEMATTNTRYEI